VCEFNEMRVSMGEVVVERYGVVVGYLLLDIDKY
jgi:hypothetical protein